MERTLILDNNVWAYIADDDAADDLSAIGRSHDAAFLVAPTVVLEQLRLKNEEVRDRLLRVTTDDRWVRMMPEAYFTAGEIVGAARRLRPSWTIGQSSERAMATYEAAERRWRSEFWAEARDRPTAELARTAAADEAGAELALGGLRDGRRIALQEGMALDRFSLVDPELVRGEVRFDDDTTVELDAWQLSSAVHSRDHLFGSLADQTMHEWLDPYFDTAVALDEQAWVRFWAEVQPDEAPAHWSWWAGGLCSQSVKVNAGAPGDVNLTAYLTSADYFVTADRRFHNIAAKIYAEAPVRTAESVLVARDAWLDGIEGVLTARPASA